MKNRFLSLRLGAFVILILSIVLLASCSSVNEATANLKGLKIREIVSRDAAAIERTLGDFDACYVEAVDLSDQILSQVNADNILQEAVTYTINVRIHDINALSDYSVLYQAPEYDLASPNSYGYAHSYVTDLRQSLSDGILEYTRENAMRNFIEIPLDMTINTTNDVSSANISHNSLVQLNSRISKMHDEVYLQILNLEQDAITSLTLADMKSDILWRMFSSAIYTENVLIDSIEVISPTEAIMRISYPDPDEIYDTLAQSAIDDHNSPVFGSFGLYLNADDFFYEHTTTQSYKTGEVEIRWSEFHNPIDAYYTGDSAFNILDEIINAMGAATNAAETSIRERWLVEPVDTPRTGVMTGQSSGNEVRVRTSADSGNYYLQFYQLPGRDYTASGELKLTVFIRGGERHTVRLPAGNYSLIYGTGSTWYGEEYRFGPAGSYNRMDSLITSQRGYYTELTLYFIEGGNTGLTPVPYN